MECIFLNLHYIQKNLEYWQSKAQVSYFIILKQYIQFFLTSKVVAMRLRVQAMERTSCRNAGKTVNNRPL